MKTDSNFIYICLKDKCIWTGRPDCPICGTKKTRKIRKNSPQGKVLYETIKKTKGGEL